MYDTSNPEYAAIPATLTNGLILYAKHGIPPGGFLKACLCNDFMEAVGRADNDSLIVLRNIARFIYNELPAHCWGSPETVEAWIEQHDQKRQSA